MTDCIFCSIVAGDLPSTVLAETDTVLAFRDINPIAPVHVLVIPKAHIADSAADITAVDGPIVGEMLELAAAVAELEHLNGTFRLITNSGSGAGQTVFHLHFHLLGGWGRDGGSPQPLGDEAAG